MPISSTYKQMNLNHIYKHISNNNYLIQLFLQIHTFYTYSFYWLHRLKHLLSHAAGRCPI